MKNWKIILLTVLAVVLSLGLGLVLCLIKYDILAKILF